MFERREDRIRLVNSSVQFALAFTLVFLVHEIGLVLPARLMGAEEATLFHNNMTFRMTDPVQTLAFGTGPLAALLLGAVAAAAFLALPRLGHSWRRFLLWLAVHGAVMFFGQAPAVAHGPDGDLARAVYALGWPPLANRLFAIGGVLALVGTGVWLGRATLVALAPPTADLDGRGERLAWLATWILVPGVLGALLCVPFRVPPLERAVLPFTTVLGTGWSLLAALGGRPAPAAASAVEERIGWGWIAALAGLLAAVRLVLVPGLPIG